MVKTDDTISFSIPCYPEPLQMTRQVQDIVFDQDKKIMELEKRLAAANAVIEAARRVAIALNDCELWAIPQLKETLEKFESANG